MNSTTLSPNKRTAARFFELLEQEDFDGMFELIDPDCKIWNPNDDYTKTEFMAVASQMFGVASASYKADITGLTEEGNRVAVEVRGEMPLKNGNIYRNRYHWLFVLKDGKFIEMREYTDTWASKVAFKKI